MNQKTSLISQREKIEVEEQSKQERKKIALFRKHALVKLQDATKRLKSLNRRDEKYWAEATVQDLLDEFRDYSIMVSMAYAFSNLDEMVEQTSIWINPHGDADENVTEFMSRIREVEEQMKSKEQKHLLN